MWGIDDVTFCLLHNHNVSFIYIARDTDPYAEIYRFVLADVLLLQMVILIFVYATPAYFKTIVTKYASS